MGALTGNERLKTEGRMDAGAIAGDTEGVERVVNRLVVTAR